MLGQGNFSKVFRVKCKFDGLEYAIKRSFRAVTSELEGQAVAAGALRIPLFVVDKFWRLRLLHDQAHIA